MNFEKRDVTNSCLIMIIARAVLLILWIAVYLFGLWGLIDIVNAQPALISIPVCLVAFPLLILWGLWGRWISEGKAGP